MRTGRGRVEHLHEVGGGARRGERLEHGFEHPRPTEPPEALPDRVPIPELGRQCPPGDVMNGEIMKRFQKLAVVPRKRGKRAGRGFPKTRMSDSIWECCPESTSTICRRRT